MNPRGNPAAFGKLGGEAASVCQRVEDNAFHLRTLSERWIGFSEDDSFAKHYCLKKNEKKAGHPFKYLISPSKPQENSKTKKKTNKVLTRFWRFSYKRR